MLLLQSAVLANVDGGVLRIGCQIVRVVDVVAADAARIFVLCFVCCRRPDNCLTGIAHPIAPSGVAAALCIAAVFTFADSVVRLTGGKITPFAKRMVARYGFVTDDAGFPVTVLVLLISIRINAGVVSAVCGIPVVFPGLATEHAGRVRAKAVCGIFQVFAAIQAKTAFIADGAFASIEAFFAVLADHAMLYAVGFVAFALCKFLIAVFTFGFGTMQLIVNSTVDAHSAVFAPVRGGTDQALAASAGTKEFIHTAVAVLAVRVVIAVVNQTYFFAFHTDIIGIVAFQAHLAGTAPFRGTVLTNLALRAKVLVAADIKTAPAMVSVLRGADLMSFTVFTPFHTFAAVTAVRARGIIREAIPADAVLFVFNSALNACTAEYTFLHAAPAELAFRAEHIFINITAVTGRVALTAIRAGELITFR